MLQRLLAVMGIVVMIVCVSHASAATGVEVPNGSIQEIIDESHVNDRGPGSGPVTASDGMGSAKPTITFPSDTTGMKDQSRKAGAEASANSSAKATPSPNSTAPRSAGAITPLSLAPLALALLLYRAR